MRARSKKNPRKNPIDWWILFSVIALLGIGLIMVSSSTQYFAQYPPYNDSHFFLRAQAHNAVFGLIGMLFLLTIPYVWIKKAAYPALALVIVSLVMVLFSDIGEEGGGAMRWLKVFGETVQPSEFCKPILVVVVAKMLSRPSEKVKGFLSGFLPITLLMLLCCGLVVVEDLSTSVVMAVTVLLMMICGGVRGRYISGLLPVGAAAVAAAIYFEPYRMQRIFSFLNPDADSTGDGFQIIQSLYAIGSGGLFGAGPGGSTAKWYYLPARHTDFIFSIYAEEGGLLACLALLILFALLIWRGLKVAVQGRNTFVSMAAFGITALIGVQTIINLLVVIGFAPVTGITLPFISYGGSSLVVSLSMTGFLLNLSKHRLAG